MSSRRTALLAALILTACGGGPPRSDPAPTPGARVLERGPGPIVVPSRTRYLDEDCELQADFIRVVLPRVLRSDLATEALTGGWEGNVYRGRGRVQVTIRKLRLLTERIEIRLTRGPIEDLRVMAEGDARISATTFDRVNEPVGAILLRPDAVLLD